jgi:hypothetical protein
VSRRERWTDYIALDVRVLAVAVEGWTMDWSCYVGAVEGDKHSLEVEDVKRHGSKVSERVARAFFPNEPWKSLRYRH